MSATKAFLCLTMIFLSLERTQAYISRTSCRNSANFTELQKDKFVKDEGNIIRHANVNRSRCALLCIATPSCFFINHKRDNTLCRLVTSLDVKMNEIVGWDVVQTDYRLWHQRGPLCRYLDVKSKPFDYCVDTCEPPGYEIKRIYSIVSGLTAVIKGSRYSNEYSTTRLTDDNPKLLLPVSNQNDAPVITFTLNKGFPLCLITVTRAGEAIPVIYDIIIGETGVDEDYCVKNFSQLIKFQVVTCDKCPMFGKEVHFRIHRYDSEKNKRNPTFRQIRIYES